MNFRSNYSKGSFSRKCLMVAMALTLASCAMTPKEVGPDKIASINILDRNGMTETISERERLNAFEKTDFLAPQPYLKVQRIFGRQANGDIPSSITSYHPNGQLKQSLEAINNRAYGLYREWHPNGSLKIESMIIGGTADLNSQAEQSWLFEGVNRAWDEEGHLLAEIQYHKGELQGEAKYFHPNGKIWKISPYTKNVLHGTEVVYLNDATLFQTTEYQNGIKNGRSLRYWSPSNLLQDERYEKGRLIEATYFDENGEAISSIHEGAGFRPVFGKKMLQELQEYRDGVQEGVVKLFDESGALLSQFSIKNGEKEGEEITYYPRSFQPKLAMHWHEGVLQGIVKSWYENGMQESQREMSQNKKNGLSTAWYRDGTLMLVEEYDGDKLVKGEYFRAGEKSPISLIAKGSGIATLFDPQGNFSKKITYKEGKPLD